MRDASAASDVDRAHKVLTNLVRRLEKDHPGAAASLEEGLDETLSVKRLRLPKKLERQLSTTNAIENLMGAVRRLSRRVKRWRAGKMILRWTVAAVADAATRFRRITGAREGMTPPRDRRGRALSADRDHVSLEPMTKLVLSCALWVAACGGAPAPAIDNPASATTAPAGTPKAAELSQGGQVWGVYFAIAAPMAPELSAAKERVKALSYEVFDKDLNCDVPVGNKPPVEGDGEHMLIAVYFATEADARAVAARDGQPVVWVGEVKTMCMD